MVHEYYLGHEDSCYDPQKAYRTQVYSQMPQTPFAVHLNFAICILNYREIKMIFQDVYSLFSI